MNVREIKGEIEEINYFVIGYVLSMPGCLGLKEKVKKLEELWASLRDDVKQKDSEVEQ